MVNGSDTDGAAWPTKWVAFFTLDSMKSPYSKL